ncbi:SDR family oxidoreductase [Acetobacter sp.]|uniref:SDR family oxidoreductase n=1 Tax=Acetobacter sp. TaxID=440 RepID=UPI0025BADDFE|nr:SDR family oxidoreductase [Acetobacter sp.]MCH4090078.1 SDR family oxidoreductase [Acetobacter sp.]MCI1298774.1 SDR family oxidoreductase [Acetobacter sp.]MCI1314793.1 SDR family oxidoreductase [Acetobacter sp.]
MAVIGGSGFIGSEIVANLLAHGHNVTLFCRDAARTARRFPAARTVSFDIVKGRATDLAADLTGCEAVVNCVGVLKGGAGFSERDVHVTGTEKLLAACEKAGVARIIHISAIGIDHATTPYAASKLESEQLLQKASLTHPALTVVILRPSFLYGKGSYGGSSAIRGLCALPGFLPLMDGGRQKFQPVCLPDMAEVVRSALTASVTEQTAVVNVCGPEVLTTRDIALKIRAWLGFSTPRDIAVPDGLTRALARLGDVFPIGGLCSAIHEQLATDYISPTPPLPGQTTFGVTPRSMSDFLQENPSSVQDRWHAKLHALRPALSASIGLLWLGSGLAGLAAGKEAETVLSAKGVPPRAARAAGYGFSLVDLFFVWEIFTGRVHKRGWRRQAGLVAGYSVGLTILKPGLWKNPYGALLKNLPILGLLAVLALTDDDR